MDKLYTPSIIVVICAGLALTACGELDDDLQTGDEPDEPIAVDVVQPDVPAPGIDTDRPVPPEEIDIPPVQIDIPPIDEETTPDVHRVIIVETIPDDERPAPPPEVDAPEPIGPFQPAPFDRERTRQVEDHPPSVTNPDRPPRIDRDRPAYIDRERPRYIDRQRTSVSDRQRTSE